MNDRYRFLDMNNKLVWNFRDIGHTMRGISEGKGSQKRVLIVLCEEGSMTQRALTERLGIQPGSASEVIGKLESAGMVKRTPGEADRRTMEIQLTEAGRKAGEEAGKRRKERHERMFSCFDAEEKKVLLSLLERLNADWDEVYRTQNGQSRRDISERITAERSADDAR